MNSPPLRKPFAAKAGFSLENPSRGCIISYAFIGINGKLPGLLFPLSSVHFINRNREGCLLKNLPEWPWQLSYDSGN